MAMIAAMALALASAPVDAGTLAATGPARACLPEAGLRSIELVGGGRWLMVQGLGRQRWRSEMAAGCTLPKRPVIISRANISGQFCERDQIQVSDQITHLFLTQCAVGPFTPVDLPKGTRLDR